MTETTATLSAQELPSAHQNDPSFARRVLHSVAWHGGAQLTGQFVTWAVTLILVRLLSPQDYGVMAMATMFMNFLFMAADLGLSSATVQAADVDDDTYRHVAGLVLSANAACGLALFLAAPLVGAFFGEPRVIVLIRVLSLNFVFVAFGAVSQARATRQLDFRTVAKIDLTATIISGICALAMALLGYGVWALVAGMLLQSLGRSVGYQLVRPTKMPLVFSATAVSPLIRFGALVLLDRLFFFLCANVDLLIVGRVLGKEALGLYSVALTFAAMPLQKVIPTLNQVSFAAFSRIQADPERVKRNLLRALRFASAVLFPALLGMAAIAPVMVPLILGKHWLNATIPFQLLCAVMPLRVVWAIMSPPLFGTGRAGINLGNVVISFIFVAIGCLIGVRWGLIGTAAGWILAFSLAFLIVTMRTLRALNLTLRDLLSSTSTLVIASIVMFFGVTLLDRVLAASLVGWSRLALLIAAGAATYLLVVYTADRRIIAEMKALAAA